MESAGARAIPIIYLDVDESNNNKILTDINGLLVPPGPSDDDHKTWLFEKLDILQGRIDNGYYVPIMGIDTGFHLLMEYYSGQENLAKDRVFSQENHGLQWHGMAFVFELLHEISSHQQSIMQYNDYFFYNSQKAIDLADFE